MRPWHLAGLGLLVFLSGPVLAITYVCRVGLNDRPDQAYEVSRVTARDESWAANLAAYGEAMYEGMGVIKFLDRVSSDRKDRILGSNFLRCEAETEPTWEASK